MDTLVGEVKKNKFSVIGDTVSDDDVASVWDNVASFVDRQMTQQKGVCIPGLGTFTFCQKKLDVGNNKYLLTQRPIFCISEKFAQTHGLNFTKYHTSGQIPVVPLNYTSLALESPFSRDVTETCVREVIAAMNRSLGAKKNVEFTFVGLGKLQIRDSKVKMKFYKDFINQLDSSGKLVDALQNRPGTGDSVMSDRAPSRPHTSNTLVLPKISQGHLIDSMPPIEEEVAAGGDGEGLAPADCLPIPEEGQGDLKEDADAELADIQLDMEPGDVGEGDGQKKPLSSLGSRAGSRVAAPLAVAAGVSFIDDLLPPKPCSRVSKCSPSPLMMKRSLSPIHTPKTPSDLANFKRPHTSDNPPGSAERLTPLKMPTPPPPKSASPQQPGESRCGHNAGQELCYLCHQRSRRNIPVSFTDERKLRELEEEKLLQQYQHMKATEFVLGEQEKELHRRQETQKMAAFNLGVADAVKQKKTLRPTDFHPSYIFQKRPLTPPRFIKQERYFNDLSDQVLVKDDKRSKQKADESFLERLEQVQLAEDLAEQRQVYLKERNDQVDQYRKALSAQLKFKPVPIPARVPDSQGPIFGKNDMNAEKMLERRRHAYDLYQQQLATVENRKRDAILKRLNDQKEEESMLKKTKEELLEDRADRYERGFMNRKRLEDAWAKSVDLKKCREVAERERSKSPGQLIHEQCDKYQRCSQCKRKTINCGETNIWRESYYLPGSRIMV